MPQSSITAWLKKPLGVREPAISSIPLSIPESVSSNGTELPLKANEQTSSQQYATPTLPNNVTLSPFTKELIPAFKRVNQLLLPIPYPKKFYDEILEDEVIQTISRVALWNDDGPSANSKSQLVAAIRCRLLGPSSDPMLYISTLTCLSPYRGHGLATALLMDVMTRALDLYGIRSVTAHVWEGNEEGRLWYKKRGFVEETNVEGYYKRLRPNTAILVRKRVSIQDLVPPGCFMPSGKDAAANARQG
jgi:N-alpha-acetyltransferase 50